MGSALAASIQGFLEEARFRLWSLAIQQRELKEVSSHPQAELVHSDQLISYLSQRLRKHPAWARGHELLSRAALKVQDYQLAYSSAQALLKLSKRGDGLSIATGHLLLGQCYLKQGQSSYASSAFMLAQKAISAAPSSKQRHTLENEIREDLAAAYILEERYPAALAELKLIPEDELTPEAASALAFLKQKSS